MVRMDLEEGCVLSPNYCDEQPSSQLIGPMYQAQLILQLATSEIMDRMLAWPVANLVLELVYIIEFIG